MAEYIDRGKLVENLNKFAPEYYNALINNLISKQHTEDVEPIVHGHNIYSGNPVDGFCCSKCFFYTEDVGRLEYDEDTDDTCMYEYEFRYCPNCGARMDGD